MKRTRFPVKHTYDIKGDIITFQFEVISPFFDSLSLNTIFVPLVTSSIFVTSFLNVGYLGISASLAFVRTRNIGK